MLEPVGDALNDATVADVATSLSQKLGSRIRPVSVLLKSADEMPKRSDGGPAFGFWRSGLRQVWLWNQTDAYPVGKTLAHEAMHVLDTDWLTKAQRQKLMELMAPAPTKWNDQRIEGVLRKYVSLPSEIFAVYASAAIGRFPRPAYRSLFIREIAPEKWDAMRELILEDDGPAEEEEEATEEVFTPPDPFQEFAKQLQDAELRARNAEAKFRRARALALKIGQL